MEIQLQNIINRDICYLLLLKSFVVEIGGGWGAVWMARAWKTMTYLARMQEHISTANHLRRLELPHEYFWFWWILWFSKYAERSDFSFSPVYRKVAETQETPAFFHIREGATVGDHKKRQNQEQLMFATVFEADTWEIRTIWTYAIRVILYSYISMSVYRDIDKR